MVASINRAATEGTELVDFTKHAASAYHASGLYDIVFFDIPKMLHEVVVITEPLPANTSFTMDISLDGDTPISITAPASASTTGATTHKFTVSDTTTTRKARRFEVVFTLATTDDTVTPTIRSWTARATSAAHEREITLAIDASTSDEQEGSSVLSALDTLVTNQNLVTLELPYEVRNVDAPESIVVQVDEVQKPDLIRDEAQVAAVIKLRARDLIE